MHEIRFDGFKNIECVFWCLMIENDSPESSILYLLIIVFGTEKYTL